MPVGQRGGRDFPVDIRMKEAFEKYRALLLKWNKTHNLTRITIPEEIAVKHFEDSLAPLPLLMELLEPSSTSSRLLDIGSGAGFPGIPLKIECSGLEVVLLEPSRKRVQFCEAVIRELGLQGINVVSGRSEDPSLPEKLGLFDVVISRATFSIERLLKEGSPFCKKEGIMIAMKGRDWRKERLEKSEWKVVKAVDYDLTRNFGQRSLIAFKRR